MFKWFNNPKSNILESSSVNPNQDKMFMDMAQNIWKNEHHKAHNIDDGVESYKTTSGDPGKSGKKIDNDFQIWKFCNIL